MIGIVKRFLRRFQGAGRRIEIGNKPACLVKRRLVVVSHSGIGQQPREKPPVVLDIGARGPCAEVPRRVASQTKSIGRQTEKQVGEGIPRKNSTRELVLAAVI